MKKKNKITKKIKILNNKKNKKNHILKKILMILP